MECKPSGFGDYIRLAFIGNHQLLPDHFLRPELCFPCLCEVARLYLGGPLPGMQPVRQVPDHGSDAGAILWWGVPVGFIESRSLLEQGELPLWNRYSHAGDTLIGQAVSMLGDPLQLIVIFGHGSAGAWDIKYLTAKFLFCIGFGLLILRLLENRVLSLIYAGLAAYCGAWFFINNHPAFFVFSYAPWILLSAFGLLDLRSEQPVRWGFGPIVANFGCFNGGHIEMAVVLIGGLNLTAVASALTGCRKVADTARVVGRMAAGTLFFLGLTAPVWLSFLTALDGSFTSHSEIQIIQLPLASLPGAFDDLFYLLLLKNDFLAAPAPGTSLLVLAGCILSVLRWRQLKGESFFGQHRGHHVVGWLYFWMDSHLCFRGHSTVEPRWSYLHRFFLSAGHPPDHSKCLWFQVPGERGGFPAGGG